MMAKDMVMIDFDMLDDIDFPTVFKCFFNFFFLFSHQPMSYCYIIAYPDYYYLLLYFDQVIPDFRPIFMQDALSTIAPLL